MNKLHAVYVVDRKRYIVQPARAWRARSGPTDSINRVSRKRVVHREYRVHVLGTVPTDLSMQVSTAHASAIRGLATLERAAKSR